MQGPGVELQELPVNLEFAQRSERYTRTSLECCGEAKASLLTEGVLGDGITEQEELFIYGRL